MFPKLLTFLIVHKEWDLLDHTGLQRFHFTNEFCGIKQILLSPSCQCVLNYCQRLLLFMFKTPGTGQETFGSHEDCKHSLYTYKYIGSVMCNSFNSLLK